MKNKKTEANISMVVSKTFSGLNMNALKYLLPLWMSPLTGASFRCVFAAVAFWVIGWFMKPEVSTTKDKVWLFLIMVFFYKEKATWMKILGILIGLSGALVCILTQQSDDLAADAFNGNMLCLASSVFYAVYLVLSQRILQKVGTMTMLRYTFTGAAFSSLLILPIEGFHAPLFSEPFHWWPFAVLMFVLIFPTVISYLLIPIGLKYLKTTLVAIYGYLILIVATITSLLIGQDRFSWTQTFAIICICAGVYLVEIAEGKEKKTVKV